MDILSETKNKDGSVNLECDCTQEELEFLAGIGLNVVLREYIEKSKKERENCQE